MSYLQRIKTENRKDFNLFLHDFKIDYDHFTRSELIKEFNLTIKNVENEYFNKHKIISINNIKVGFIYICEFDNEYNFICDNDHDLKIKPEDNENLICFEYAERLKDLIFKLCSVIYYNKNLISK